VKKAQMTIIAQIIIDSIMISSIFC